MRLLPKKFLSISIFLILPLSTLFSQAKPREFQRYTFAHQQMGTWFRIVLYAADSVLAHKAANRAFARIDSLNNTLSDYIADSELNMLSASAGNGQIIKVSRDLWVVLCKSLEVAKKSKGAFDVTVGPYVKLWRRSRRQGELPAEDALVKAKKSVGYTYIKLYPGTQAVQLLVSGMQLDLGGIGKGYAVDEAMKVLRHHGITSALVDGGGNIVVSEAPPGQKGWQVEVGSLAENNANLQDVQQLQLAHRGMASSGDIYQYAEINGKRYSHIIDPRTGIGLTNQDMVTVIAPDGTTADILSTTISVLGLQKGIPFLKKYKAQACFIQKTNGRVQQWKDK